MSSRLSTIHRYTLVTISMTAKTDNAPPFYAGVIEAVPANGSRSVALDIGVTSDFLAQFNINYNTNDGSQQKYTSQLFHVVHNLREISQTVTWNLQALSTTSLESPTPSKLQTASTQVSVTTSTTTSATTLALTSTVASKPSNPTPHLAAGIGLGVGISLGIAAMGLIGFLFRKKKKINSDRRRSRAISQNSGTPVNEGTVTEELDARQRLVELSVGRLDAELDAGHPTLQGAVLQDATTVVR